MGDLVFIAIVIAFFAVAVLYVTACDRIIGPDPSDLVDRGESDADAESSAEVVR